MDNGLPLVSFCIKCYNQEHLIKEALKGAFEQTYSNMEIIVSDDCSRDNSVQVIKDACEEYRKRGGRFPIRIIENDQNLGNGGNWEKLCSVARGEWFVKADGDDRSLPTRVEEIIKLWIDGGRKATCIGSDAVLIDMKGRSLGPVRRRVLQTNRIAGCVAAYHRSTYDVFGPVSVKAATDDGVYGPRAEMLGPTAYVEKPLVLYRVGAGASRGVFGFRERRLRNFKATYHWIDQWECDVNMLSQNKKGFEEKCSAMRISIENWRKSTDRNILTWANEWHSRVRTMRLRPFKALFTISGIYKFALLLPNFLCDIVLDFMHVSHMIFLRMRYNENLTTKISGLAIYTEIMRYRYK